MGCSIEGCETHSIGGYSIDGESRPMCRRHHERHLRVQLKTRPGMRKAYHRTRKARLARQEHERRYRHARGVEASAELARITARCDARWRSHNSAGGAR